MIYKDLELIEYKRAWNVQEELFKQNIAAKRQNKETSNVLLVCEHPHVITIGKSGKTDNLLFSDAYLSSQGVALFQIDRGGDVTYHGPGQLVVYPIFDLDTYKIGLRQYIYNLEEVMIRLLSIYGVVGERSEAGTGVWLDIANPRTTRKIGAIGVRSSHYITMHGFALNINTDLSYFSLINPCGFVDKGVTSLSKEIHCELDMSVVKEQIKILFDQVFT